MNRDGESDRPPLDQTRPRNGIERVRSLDGLRGLAALVVLVHHSMLVAPALSDAYLAPSPGPVRSWAWLISYTPLHLVWAGTEAVFVFFILSGFVLTVPRLSGRSFHWRAYYAQRLVRLYIPLAAAALVAWVLVRAVAREWTTGDSGWLRLHQAGFSARAVVRDAAVVRGVDSLNTAFWSLQWEVYFSLLLPAFFLVLLSRRLAPPLSATGLVLLMLAGQTHQWPAFGGVNLGSALFYLPMFGLGVLMAREHGRLVTWGNRFNHLSGRYRTITVVALCAGLTVSWPAAAVPYVPEEVLGVLRVAEVLAGCGVVWLFATTSLGRGVGMKPAVLWLGKVSFSLYLVHEPIVVTVGALLGSTTNPLLVLAVAVPVALVAAGAFFQVVEQPAHQLARRVGALAGGRS